jgi:transposase InsO family protein
MRRWLASSGVRPVAASETTPTNVERLLEDVEFAALKGVAWYNGNHLLEPLGYVPPAEFEKAYHDFWDGDWGTS